MNAKLSIKGLYAITPDMADTDRLCALVLASIHGGTRLLQYRNKAADSSLRIKQALALLAICRQHDVTFIINDDVKLCLALDADGVHVGAEDIANYSVAPPDDLPIQPASSRPSKLSNIRERLGKHKLLGVSCYNRLQLAQYAQTQGADYVAFGACFPSGTKPAAVTAELSLFSQAKLHLQLPLVAIGGITLANAAAVIDAGADAIAVINALWRSDDIAEASRKFCHLYTH